MSWMKNFPKNRKPYFLYILTTHLVSESPNTPENEKKLMQMLAYKNMSKAIQLAFEDEKGGYLFDNTSQLLTPT